MYKTPRHDSIVYTVKEKQSSCQIYYVDRDQITYMFLYFSVKKQNQISRQKSQQSNTLNKQLHAYTHYIHTTHFYNTLYINNKTKLACQDNVFSKMFHLKNITIRKN